MRIGLGLSMLALACGSGMGAATKRLRTRAAFDLRCGEQELRVHELDRRTRGVEGCGKQATYVIVCRGEYDPALNSEMCDWILNTADGQAAQGTPATGPARTDEEEVTDRPEETP